MGATTPHLPHRTNRPNRLARLREAQGLSRTDLAQQITGLVQARSPHPVGDVSVFVVERWERGEVPIPERRRPDLAALFGVSVPYLLGTEDDQGPRAA